MERRTVIYITLILLALITFWWLRTTSSIAPRSATVTDSSDTTIHTTPEDTGTVVPPPGTNLIAVEVASAAIGNWATASGFNDKTFLYVSQKGTKFTACVMVPHAAGVKYVNDGDATLSAGVWTIKVKSITATGNPAQASKITTNPDIAYGTGTSVTVMNTSAGGGQGILLSDADNETVTAFSNTTPIGSYVASVSPAAPGYYLYAFVKVSTDTTVTVGIPVGTQVKLTETTTTSTLAYRFISTADDPDPRAGVVDPYSLKVYPLSATRSGRTYLVRL